MARFQRESGHKASRSLGLAVHQQFAKAADGIEVGVVELVELLPAGRGGYAGILVRPNAGPEAVGENIQIGTLKKGKLSRAENPGGKRGSHEKKGASDL